MWQLMTMHLPSPDDEKLFAAVGEWVLGRLTHRSETLPRKVFVGELSQIGNSGIGVENAWLELRDRLIPTAMPTDHPRYLSFIPGAPSVAAVLADMTMSAAGIYAGSELEAGALVQAERAALRWLSDLLGLPDTAHGTFVSGGSIATLSGLVTARDYRHGRTGQRPNLVVAGASGHSSIASAASIMGCDLVAVGGPDGPLSAESLRRALDSLDVGAVAAVAATAGATNDGSIDELDGIAELCHERGLWLHVDAAYGGAAMLSERARPLFAGMELADSVTINPHKWFFTPFDCAAILYRNPEPARRSHSQRAPYLELVSGGDNPSDHSIELSRRARGIPFWVSLLANGTDAYRDAIEYCLDLTAYAAATIAQAAHLELLAPPNLSIVLFRRDGWTAADYQAWSDEAIESGLGLLAPTRYHGAPALRLCFVNPITNMGDIDRIVASLA